VLAAIPERADNSLRVFIVDLLPTANADKSVVTVLVALIARATDVAIEAPDIPCGRERRGLIDPGLLPSQVPGSIYFPEELKIEAVTRIVHHGP
jgi:hypothetical protein